MLIEILIALFLGILAGTLTGLLPGIHINLVGAMLVSLSISAFASINPIYLVVFVASMSITHTFLDFIPSIFLGCPDTDTELSILPGHEMLKQGKGYEAVMLSAQGGFFSVIMLIVLSLPLIYFVPKIYPAVSKAIPFILMGIILFMIFSEKKKIQAIMSLILAGILGIIVLNPINLSGLELNLKEPLLPLLSGLFGASSIILSIKTKTKIPKQEITRPHTPLTKPLAGTLISSPLCGFLPGLGSGQAAIIGNTIFKTDQKGFLILLGATNTLIMGFSFISLYTIHKLRTGSAATINSLIGTPDIKILILILLTCLASGIISFFLASFLSKKFIRVLERINYAKLSLAALSFVILIILIFSGVMGLAVFAISTFTGIYCISLGARRTNMMACLLIPTIILYLF